MSFKFISPSSRVVCPYCFDAFHLSEARLRLNSGGKVPDEHVGKFLDPLGHDKPPEMMPVIDLPGGRLTRLARKFATWRDDPKRGSRVCPNCHLPLPLPLAQAEQGLETIGLIGARSSGKSNFIGVLVHELYQRFQREVGFHVMDEESFHDIDLTPVPSRTLHRERYGSLYERRNPTAIPISVGVESKAGRRLRFPLILRLEFAPRTWITPPRSVQLVLFDAAGEDLEKNMDTVNQLYPYLSKARGLIFLLDPWELPGVQDDLDSQGIAFERPNHSARPGQVIDTVVRAFEKFGGYSASARHKIPTDVAFAFSKADSLDTLVPAKSRIRLDSRHEGGFNEEDSLIVHDELVQHVDQVWHGGEISSLGYRFRKHRFFALSALGQTPGENYSLMRPPMPRRVADPLLWLLHGLGYIGTSHPSSVARS